MTDDPKAIKVLRDHDRMVAERSTWDGAFRDIRALVRPNSVDFNSSRSPGDIRTINTLDSTAIQANTDLAGEIVSTLLPQSDRAWGISIFGDEAVSRNPDVIGWCDTVANIIHSSWGDERSQHTSSVHEAIQDVTAFGNAVISQEWNADEWSLIFMARPLANCFFYNDINGIVNNLSRCEKLSLDKIKTRWPEAKWEGMDREPEDRKYEVIHAVYPRAQHERQYGRSDGPNMPYASCWVLREKKLILEEGGYVSFPYHVPRWNKVADEDYGRGPGMNCLPSIRMLNRMKLTTIKAAQKATDPPIWLPNEGVRLPYKDEPGAVNFYDPSVFSNGFNNFAQEHKGNFPVTMETMEAERLDIRKAFYIDWMEWFPKTERQTAEEIRELKARKYNKMAPLLGRLETELLVPKVSRSYELLSKAAMIPPAPAILDGKRLKVVYVSAAARAEKASKSNAIMVFIQQVVPLAQVDPRALDALNIPATVRELAIQQDIPRSILRSEEEIEAIQSQREQQEQAAAVAGAAEPVSQAVLNIAKAQEAGGVGTA